MKKEISPPSVGTVNAPYSAAIQVDRWLYISGQVALDEQGNSVRGDDLAAQTRQIFDNIGAILEAAGGSFDDVVKVNYFVLSIDEFPSLVELRREYFQPPYPAATSVEVSALMKPEWLIEIEAVALLPEHAARS